MTHFQSSATHCFRSTRVCKSTREPTYRRLDEPARTPQPPARHTPATHERCWHKACHDSPVSSLQSYQSEEDFGASTRRLERISRSAVFSEPRASPRSIFHCTLSPSTGPIGPQATRVGNHLRARARSYTQCVVLGQSYRGPARPAMRHKCRSSGAGKQSHDRSTGK